MSRIKERVCEAASVVADVTVNVMNGLERWWLIEQIQEATGLDEGFANLFSGMVLDTLETEELYRYYLIGQLVGSDGGMVDTYLALSMVEGMGLGELRFFAASRGIITEMSGTNYSILLHD